MLEEERHDSYVEPFAADNPWVGRFRVVQDIIGQAFRAM